MRTRVLRVAGRSIVVCFVSVSVEAAERDRSSPRPVSDVKVSSDERAGSPTRVIPLFSDTGEPMGTYYPMAREMRRQGGVAGASDPDAACRADPGAVYCNSLSPGWWRPPGDNPNIQVGDDAAIAAVAGCELDRYVLKVNGNADGLGVGPYSIDSALYEACPGAGGATPIPGTGCHIELPDESAAVIVCHAAPGTVLPSSNVWVSVRFDRLHCAIAVGAPATKGFSADVVDFPGFACTANFGGFMPRTDSHGYGQHASFFLEIYSRGACADPGSDSPTEAFPNYRSSNHNGLPYTPGGGIRFADDVSLETPQCFMTALEVAIKGNGVVNIDLRTALNDVDPVHGGVIPGTGFFVIGGDDVVIGRKDFDPPILLNQPDLWVGYHTTSGVTGPIVTARPAALGRNEDSMWVHGGTRWQAGPLADGRYAATDVTIHCADRPPTGACCDMIFTDNHTCVGGDRDGQPCTSTFDCPAGICLGDSLCRDDLPAMNCPTSDMPRLWRRGDVCEGVCDGGDNDGSSCTRQVDCPGFRCVGGVTPGATCGPDAPCNGGVCKRAECDGPFVRSCGLAACCTLRDGCFDLIEKECYAAEPLDEERDYQLGEICGISGQRCPRVGPCGDGNCCVPNFTPGCENAECCQIVCSVDPWCCLVEWDASCAELARASGCCSPPRPSNDECAGPGDEGAHAVPVPGNVAADVEYATENVSDPSFCCDKNDRGTQGIGTVWFKFVAPEPANTQDEFSSVRINTCQTNSYQGRDSLIQVFEPANPDHGTCSDGAVCSISGQNCTDASTCVLDEETACQTLIPIVCNDDAVPACARPGLSRICLPHLVPGQTYYVSVAAKDEQARDTYRLETVEGCGVDTPLSNDVCDGAERLDGGFTEPLVVPFDLTGGEEYANATYDCYSPQGIFDSMENDVWFDWIAPADGQATIETCDRAILQPLEQPDTTMIIYEGCDCPIDDARIIAASDSCDDQCGPSSCVTFDTTAGRCYKIRLGGHLSGTPAGDLTVKSEGSRDELCRDDPHSVYCNTLGPVFWQPEGGSTFAADDVILAAVSGCELDRYVVKVTGNADGLGVGGYTVNTALYPGCPLTGSVAQIPGTECEATFGDNGVRLITCSAALAVTLPPRLFLGIRFDRPHCGIALGAPATKGFSADAIGWPPEFEFGTCRSNLGGYLPTSYFDEYGLHASFYAEIYTREDCPNAFAAYTGSFQAGLQYTPGGGIRFADDVSLQIPHCFLTRIEVAIRGNGVTNIDLRTTLDDQDPVNGGVIPGTPFFVIGSPGVVIGSKDFDPPVLLPTSDLWVGYSTTSAVTGPVITGRRPDLGRNEYVIWVHNGTRWEAGPLVDGRYAATDVTIFCADSPPVGACCDMVFTENNVCTGGANHGDSCARDTDCPGGTCTGDSICRDNIPRMNCPTGSLPRLWAQGNVCEGVCVGGDNDGLPCTGQIDCPGFRCVGGLNPGAPCQTDEQCNGGVCRRAECDAPFIRSCGLAACCTPEDECFDLMEKECFEYPPIDKPGRRMYQLGEYCGVDGQRCPFTPCLGATGDCHIPHPALGCKDPFCCIEVCIQDPYCCIVEWDLFCVDLAIECHITPANDECSGRYEEGARLVYVPGSVVADLANASANPSDPGFCCHAEEPGEQGVATVWFKFVGPEPAHTQDEFSSVRIDTCQSNSPHSRDSLVQVFTMSEPDRGDCTDGTVCSVLAQDCEDESRCVTVVYDETACRTLIPIGCSDDTEVGCARPGNSRLCLPQVVPGWTYYVLVAAKSEEYRDTYQLNIVQGCTADLPIPNDMCGNATLLESSGTMALTTPFDLSGGEDYAAATYDCMNPHDVLANMENDIWFNWIAPCDGEVTIETCDHALPVEEQPNTTMIVYEGCDCLANAAQVIEWNDFCGLECGLSSCVTMSIHQGQCYTIRLGGHLGGEPSGTLTIAPACPACPAGTVSFLDPISGTVDAGRPHLSHGFVTLQGIDSFLVEAPAGADIAHCWRLCESAAFVTDNFVQDIIDNGDGTFTVQLDRPITPGAATEIVYTDNTGTTHTAVFYAHPANVDADKSANPTDVSVLIDILNGSATPPHGHYSADCNRSGSITPADLLCVMDLLNGADAYAPGWNGTVLPTPPTDCTRVGSRR